MAEINLTPPLKDFDVKKLRLGDVAYLTGKIYTARDEAHIRALELIEKNKKLPVEFKDGVIFHCGPIVKKVENKWVLVAAGPTTSSRMNSLEPKFIEKTGIKAIVGKGGMNRATIDAMKKFNCVYFAITGGAAVLAAKGIKGVEGVEWLDLGMPEALWILETHHFGPLIVAIDTYGNSLYENVDKEIKNNLSAVRKKLGLN